jgi:hypothetical protein
MNKTFEIGKTYSTRSACDYDCIYAWTVISRTAKQLTLESRHGEITKRGIQFLDGVESCFPSGRYSMAPVIRADREAV